MNRRIVIQGALASAAALSSAGALAALSDRDLKALKGAVDAGFEEISQFQSERHVIIEIY